MSRRARRGGWRGTPIFLATDRRATDIPARTQWKSSSKEKGGGPRLPAASSSRPRAPHSILHGTASHVLNFPRLFEMAPSILSMRATTSTEVLRGNPSMRIRPRRLSPRAQAAGDKPEDATGWTFYSRGVSKQHSLRPAAAEKVPMLPAANPILALPGSTGFLDAAGAFDISLGAALGRPPPLAEQMSEVRPQSERSCAHDGIPRS